MKYLKEFNKLIEGLLFLFLPVVLFYWSLTLINLDIVKPIISFLGMFIDPLIEPIREMITYRAIYADYTVDYTILLFSAIILVLAFALTLNGHILCYVEGKMEQTKIKQKNKEILKHKQEQKEEFIRDISQNKVIYVIFKLIKIKPTESYLVKEGDDDFFSENMITSYQNTILNIFKKNSATFYGNIENDQTKYGYMFFDVENFLEFLPNLTSKIEEINKGMNDLNTQFEFKISCHCSFTEASADVDFLIASKILNLCGNKEILLSELLKNRLEITGSSDFNLYSRGVYLIQDKQMDVYKLQYIN